MCCCRRRRFWNQIKLRSVTPLQRRIAGDTSAPTKILRVSTHKAGPFACALRKERRQDVRNEIHQTVADHIRREIASPKIKTRENTADGESD